MDERPNRTEVTITILAILLAFAGISVVLFLFIANNGISHEKDWSFIILAYCITIVPLVLFLLFPALLGETFFTSLPEDWWNDPYEREILIDMPYLSVFDRCLDSLSLLRNRRIDPDRWWMGDVDILEKDRKNGIIIANTNDHQHAGGPYSGLWSLVLYGFPSQNTVTYSLKRLEPSQILVRVRSSRTPDNVPRWHFNKKVVDAVCDFLLDQT
ncbi:MAG: hypothetical protein WC379_10920 [Methanoregula sp.]|jgi:hypothetical protein